MHCPVRHTAPFVATPRLAARRTDDICWNLLIMFSLFIASNLLMPSFAYAQLPATQTSFNNVVLAMTGMTGKAVATIGFIVLGLGALFGKVSWQQAILATAGLGLIFGASTIVSSLGAQAGASTLSTGTGDAFANAINGVLNIILGPTGIALATIAVIAVGISAMLGRITHQSALLVAVGIALVFGSAGIVRQLGGTAAVVNAPAGSNSIEVGLYYIVGRMVGPSGVALATLGITALGLGAFFGKISYPTALVIVVGITLVFGAAGIVTQIQSAMTTTTIAKTNGIEFTLVTISNFMTSTTGVALGIIAVAILGIGAFFGKISFPVAVVCIIGFALVFGSVTIVAAIRNVVVPGGVNGNGGNALAISTTVPGGMLDNVVDFLHTDAGEALGAIAVGFIGIGAFFGKISYPAAIVAAVGITLIFGSAVIVAAIAPARNALPANGTDCFGTVMGNFAFNLQGDTSKAVASLGVIIIGIGALFGKISYASAIVTVVGIATVFGAGDIYNLLVTNLDTGQANSPITTPKGGTGIEGVVCMVANILVGSAGKAIASIAIIMLGIGAMLGKVSYHLAFTVIAGLGCMFGAQSILTLLIPHFQAGCGSAATNLPQC